MSSYCFLRFLAGKLLQCVWERTVYHNEWESGETLRFERNIQEFRWRFEITDTHNRFVLYCSSSEIKYALHHFFPKMLGEGGGCETFSELAEMVGVGSFWKVLKMFQGLRG